MLSYLPPNSSFRISFHPTNVPAWLMLKTVLSRALTFLSCLFVTGYWPSSTSQIVQGLYCIYSFVNQQTLLPCGFFLLLLRPLDFFCYYYMHTYMCKAWPDKHFTSCHSTGTSPFRICSDQPALPYECCSLTNAVDCSVSSINVSVLFVCHWLLTKIAPRFFSWC